MQWLAGGSGGFGTKLRGPYDHKDQKLEKYAKRAPP